MWTVKKKMLFDLNIPNISLQVMKNDDIDLDIDDDDTESLKIPPPKMTINVKSTDALQLTMTKACLEVLTNLGKV